MLGQIWLIYKRMSNKTNPPTKKDTVHVTALCPNKPCTAIKGVMSCESTQYTNDSHEWCVFY